MEANCSCRPGAPPASTATMPAWEVLREHVLSNAQMGFPWGRAAKGCLVEQRGEPSFQGAMGGVQGCSWGGVPGWLVLSGGRPGARGQRACAAGMADSRGCVCFAHWCSPRSW